MPIDIQKLNIDLSSSNNPLARAAGEIIRVNRRMMVDFCPGADRKLFERLLESENTLILRNRRAKSSSQQSTPLN